MNHRNYKLTAAILVFFSLIAFVLIVREGRLVKRSKPPPPAEAKTALVRDTLTEKNNLYFNYHPYLDKAHQFNNQNNFDSAIIYYKIASTKFEHEQDWLNLVWVNGYIGRLYLYVGDKNYENALPFLQKAFEIAEKKITANHPYLAFTQFYLGLYYLEKKMGEQSLDYLNRSLVTLTTNFKEDNFYTSDVYNAIGNVYATLFFNNGEASKNYLKAIGIKESLPGSEVKSGLTSNYYNLVKLNIAIGDFDKAQSFCYEALKYIPFVKAYSSFWMELLEGVLANIYNEQRLFGKALAKLKTAIQLNTKNQGDKSYLSFYYTSMGDIYGNTGKYDSAILCYKIALASTNESQPSYSQNEQAGNAYYLLGTTLTTLERYDEALHFFKKCLAIRLKIYGDKQSQTALAFEGIASIFIKNGSSTTALKYLQSGIMACTRDFKGSTIYDVPAVSNMDNSFPSYLLINDKALLLRKLYALNPSDSSLLHSSLAHYCLSDSLITLYESKYERENTKLAFIKNNSNEQAIDCAALLYQITGRRKYQELAFNFIDKRKSALLLDALDKNERYQLSGLSVGEQKTLGLLQHELAFLQTQLEEENSNEDPEEVIIKALHSRIHITETALNTLQKKLFNTNSYYASIQNNADTIRLKEVQTFSIRKNAVILEYFWGDSAIYVVSVYQNKTDLRRISRSNTMDRYLDTFQMKLARGYVIATKENDFIGFQKSAYYLFNHLLKPFLEAFDAEGKDSASRPEIVVIPDGPLSFIPFEVLVSDAVISKQVDYRQLKYIVKSYTLSYNYSARFLLKPNDSTIFNKHPQVLALSYSTEQKPERSNMRIRADGPELLGSARELKVISSYLDGKFYKGNEATESAFKDAAAHYDILHLAVHGRADQLRSYNSHLIFKEGKDSLNDGLLYAYEIYGIPLKARLAVLSACESGTGKLNPGEGVFSIARGFFYAGCPAVIMSLWKVNDNATAFIISDFYKQLALGKPISHCIRNAKLSYIENMDHRMAHPANWAACIALGNMEPFSAEKKRYHPASPALIIIVTGGIIVGGIVVLRLRKWYHLKMNARSSSGNDNPV